jgi:hypothetical protein
MVSVDLLSAGAAEKNGESEIHKLFCKPTASYGYAAKHAVLPDGEV